MANNDSSKGVPAQRLAFGRRLRALRTRAGLTQTAAAAAAEMDRSFYAEVEAAIHSVSVDRIPALARALGVEPYELFQDAPAGLAGDR
ncbi:helix-turn-helix domain-containing protein [Streptomyces alanosinicus]|uniref:helix-turn-helix domain-containing protein n=1 Tax=Streptomyces alanosinicus TaxID=68171 RepID=UPI0016751735|nr:helix-turn-helix transcriptional regulator [Streptomyces alanosinicus]